MIRALIVIAMLVPTLASAQGRFGAQTKMTHRQRGAQRQLGGHGRPGVTVGGDCHFDAGVE